MKKIYSVISIAFFLLLPFTSMAVPSFTVSPPIIDETAQARDIITKEFTLTNTGTQPVTVFPSVNNIKMDAGGTIEKFLPPVRSDRTSSLASWIEIRRAGIKLPKGESVTVPLTIRVNPNPIPGEYHAYIGFGWGRNEDIAKELVQSGRAPGAVVTVTIEDKRNEFLRLSRFIVDRFITSAENTAATYTIKNPGDTDLVPSGEIIFYNNKGNEVATTEVNPSGQTLAPGEERVFETVVPADGMFGKHKAFLSVEYGAQLASVQDTTFFYVLPLKLILIIGGILMLLVILGALYVHQHYFDDHDHDDSEQVPLHIKDTVSDSQDHDIDLKQQ